MMQVTTRVPELDVADGEIDPCAETLCGRHDVRRIRKMMTEHSCTGHTAAAHLAGWGSVCPESCAPTGVVR